MKIKKNFIVKVVNQKKDNYKVMLTNKRNLINRLEDV